jgi:hypothetical protein
MRECDLPDLTPRRVSLGQDFRDMPILRAFPKPPSSRCVFTREVLVIVIVYSSLMTENRRELLTKVDAVEARKPIAGQRLATTIATYRKHPAGNLVVAGSSAAGALMS